MISICNSCNENAIVSVSENRRTFRIKNDSTFEVNKVEVDGCYKTEGLRCDYLFEIIENRKNNRTIKKIFYVELKGSDITHAIHQLEATIVDCSSIHNNIETQECYIIASKFPSSGASSQLLKKKFYKKNKIQLFIATKIKEIVI